MTARRWTIGVTTLALLGTVAGLWATRESPGAAAGATDAAPAPRAPGSGPASPAPPRQRLVDMQPLLTARRLAALATTPEGQELARQAERLADHSVDLAFADAMRQVADEQPEPTPQLRALAARKARAQAAVDADQRRIDELTARTATAARDSRDRLQDELEVARAQRELDHDELNDASDALERAGGDPQARIRRLKDAYEAAQKEPRAAPPPAAPGAKDDPSLLARFQAWSAQRTHVEQLRAAKQEARDKAGRLGKWRERLTQQAQAAEAQRAIASGAGTVATPGEAKPGGASPQASAPAPSPTQIAAWKRRITVIDQRIQNQQDLGDVYAEWTSLVEARARALLHELLVEVLWVLLAVAAVYAASRVVDLLLRRVQRDELRNGTLRTVAKVAVRVAGAVGVLFMILGVPAQATTIIGLAGAGLTVALKDFIVAFFGWFMLIGRNGIRVGDWVEIEGVGGEVAEIGLLHTVLLETGSWSDAGHPTGRRVSFVNSFAIEGHYFNFSTSGQWMWDELRVLIPLGQDPYPVIDGVQKLAHDETEANAKLAEQEWLKATTRYRVRSFSAAPGVNVIPTSNGVEVDVRYITRAFERHETRRRLYHAVVELMHGKRAGGEVIGAA